MSRDNYGKKKEFIVKNWDSIQSMRKTKSLQEVSNKFKGEVSKASLHFYEKMFTK